MEANKIEKYLKRRTIAVLALCQWFTYPIPILSVAMYGCRVKSCCLITVSIVQVGTGPKQVTRKTAEFLKTITRYTMYVCVRVCVRVFVNARVLNKTV